MKKSLLVAAFAVACSMNLNAQCAGAFYDGFESGSYTPTWSIGAGLTSAAVTTTNPAVGTYRIEGTGGVSTHITGLSTSFTPATPNTISWWMCPQTTGSSHNYVVAGNASVSATNCIVFCYYQAAGVIRFVSSSTFDYAATLNTWYNVELRNINWTNHTFDIYINNVLMYTSFPFRSATQNDVSRVHLYNFTSGVGVWDEIRIGNAPPISTASFTAPLCNGGNDGSINQTVASGTSPYTFAWSNGATTEDITGVPAGSYSVVVTDALGCMDTTFATITEPTAITASTMQTNLLCNGGTNGDAMVMPSGGTPGYTYLWSTGGTAATESNLAAGAYTCTITDANGCTNQQTVTITEPTLLVAGATNSGDVCPNGTATLIGTAMGGTMNYTYDWMPGSMSGSTVTDIPAGTTTYTLLVTDANGCTSSSTTTVIMNVPPAVNIGPDTTVCGGIVLSAQTAGATYLWNDNSTQNTLGVTATGIYSVVVTDANGCTASDTAAITVDVPPNGGIISNSGGIDICPGDSTSLISVGDIGNIDWWILAPSDTAWQMIGSGNPFDLGAPSLADTGTYQFIAIASSGVCMDDSSNNIFVIVHAPPMVVLSDTVACGSSLVLDATVVGATYLWSDNSTQSQLAVNTSGVYSVAVTDQFGCVGNDTVNVTLNPNPVVTGMATSMTPCLDDANVTLTGSPAPGLWTGPGVTGNSFDPSVGTGPQILTFSHTDTNGCSGQFVLTVNVNACVGISENETFGYSVYPNPNNGMFNVALSNSAEKLLIEITDLQGRVVYSSALNGTQAGNVIAVDVAHVAAGNYIMRVIADGSVSNREIIITK